MLSVDLITPEKVAIQTQADSVVVPAYDGELGILPNHAPLLAQLMPGEIRLRVGSEVRHFAISGGFVEVQKGGVKIFAETAELAQEIDVERARQAAERAKAALKDARLEEDFANAQGALLRALARLRTAETIRRSRPRHEAVR